MKIYFSSTIRCGLMVAALLSFASPLSLRAQVGNDNPTGVSGVFNGNVTTAGSYDPYTGNATRSITDLTVTGAVGTYPLSFTRTMNSRYNASAGDWQMGTAGSWRHSYQWSMEPLIYRSTNPQDRWTFLPLVYTVNYPDGRRVSFSPSNNDSKFRAGNGVSDRFQQLTDRFASESECYLLQPDGGKVWFHATIDRSENEITHAVTSIFSYEFAGIIDPHGQTTTITYPGDGSMTITEPAGRWLKLFYTSTPWMGDTVLTGVQASDGRSVTYNYGGWQPAGDAMYSYLGNVQYRDPGGNVFATAIYAYQPGNTDSNGRPLLVWCIDPMYSGRMWAISYTFAPASSGVYGLLQSENYLDPRTGTPGQVVSSLSLNGNSRTETRGDGPSRTFNYSGARLVSYSDFKNQYSYISYDGNGFVWAYQDARGKVTTTSREGKIGALSVLTHPDAEHSTQGYAYWYRDDAPYFVQIRGDERGHNTYFSRDPNNFQLTRIDYPDYPNGAYETFTYNGFGQVISHRMTNGTIETTSYDGRGLMYAHTNPDGTAYYFYDSLDRLEHVVDRRGKTTWFSYNARGQVTRVTHIDGTYSQSGYNVDGTLAWTADENHPGAETDANQRTRYAYDDYKRVVSVTNPVNETHSIVYAQDWSNAYNQTTTNPKGEFGPMSRQVHYAYDENWQRTIMRVPPTSDPNSDSNDAWTFYGYDAAGNLTWTQNPRGYVTTFDYDERNRRIWMNDAISTDRNNSGHTMNWSYDTTDNMRFATRADNATREWRYDSMNRLTDTFGFAGEHTHYDRDLAGNVYQTIDAKNAVYGYTYDGLNRKVSATYPPDAFGASRTETWHFDADGNMDLYKNPAGQYRHLFYDDRNRLYEAWWDNYAAPEVVIGYDFASRVTSIVTNTAQTTAETIVTFGYDAANRTIWENQTLSGYPTRHIETPRLSDGNREALTITTNGALYYGLRFDYNQRNQLAHINDYYGNRLTDYSYDAAGNLTYRLNYWALFSGDAFGYDELNRLTALNNGDAYVWFSHTHYQFDNVGREVARWRDEDGFKGERFWFNAADQLTRAVYQADNVATPNPSNWTRFRDYNHEAGLLNWTSVNDNGYLAQLQHSQLNQYTNVNTVPISFDGNFNQTSSYYGHSYLYNAQNQLVGGSMQATYDGLGRCVRRTLGGNTLLFTYDGWNPIIEWDASNNFRGWTIYGAGADEVLLRYDATYGPLIYKHDNQGSVTFLLQGNNQIVEKYTYDAYGRPTVTSWDYNTNSWKAPSDRSSYGNRYMFTGREWLADVQLYDYRNRLYNPDTGTFVQKDPLGFGGGDANLFRYCGGDPVNKRDPSGLQDPMFSQDFRNEMYYQGIMQNYGGIMQSYSATVQSIDLYNAFVPVYNNVSLFSSAAIKFELGATEVVLGAREIWMAYKGEAPLNDQSLQGVTHGLEDMGDALYGNGIPELTPPMAKPKGYPKNPLDFLYLTATGGRPFDYIGYSFTTAFNGALNAIANAAQTYGPGTGIITVTDSSGTHEVWRGTFGAYGGFAPGTAGYYAHLGALLDSAQLYLAFGVGGGQPGEGTHPVPYELE
jgi:RHS repeat-associated protein